MSQQGTGKVTVTGRMDAMEELRQPTLVRRDPEAHKGACGHLLVVGGSLGLSGAPRMAAMGAITAGSGLVSVVVPEPVREEVAAESPALMVQGLPSTALGTLAWSGLRPALRGLQGATAAVVGPGAGRHPGTEALLRYLVAEVPVPMVCDADALNAWARQAGPAPEAPRVFTPHPGESARLLGCTVPEVQGDREEAARALQRRLGGVVVLKGAGTLVTDGDVVLRSPTGNPGLAVGGSGDVLAGLIGGLMAQGLAALEAACAGVWIHGRAADSLRLSTGERAMEPTRLIDELTQTMADLESEAPPDVI